MRQLFWKRCTSIRLLRSLFKLTTPVTWSSNIKSFRIFHLNRKLFISSSSIISIFLSNRHSDRYWFWHQSRDQTIHKIFDLLPWFCIDPSIILFHCHTVLPPVQVSYHKQMICISPSSLCHTVLFWHGCILSDDFLFVSAFTTYFRIVYTSFMKFWTLKLFIIPWSVRFRR